LGKEEKFQIPRSCKPEVTRWGKKKSYGAPHIFGPCEQEKVEKVEQTVLEQSNGAPHIFGQGERKSNGAPHIFGPCEEEKVEKVEKVVEQTVEKVKKVEQSAAHLSAESAFGPREKVEKVEQTVEKSFGAPRTFGPGEKEKMNRKLNKN